MSGQLFNTVLIVGIGHIGSSVALNIRRANAARQILASDTNVENLDKALGLRLIDSSVSLEQGAAKADLVVICAPVGAFPTICQALAPHLKPGAIVSDVGSTKANVLAAMEAFLPEQVEKVPGHPIAGTEKSGPENAIASLFKDRWAILTPSASASANAVEKVRLLWERFGSNVSIMTADHHDHVLAMTSHLPHLIAFSVVDTANRLDEQIQNELIKYSAGGFRDFTRIAASDPTMWRDVFLNNRTSVLEVLSQFQRDLDALKQAIETADGDFLFDKFAHTRAVRQGIVDAGQAGQFDPTEKTSNQPVEIGTYSAF